MARVASKTKSAAKKKAVAGAEKKTVTRRRIEPAKSATFGTDDKRAQYARLIVFNFGVAEKLIPKDKDVNSATNAQLEAAAKRLVGGTLIEGPEGIDYIMDLSKNGSTTGRPLTASYAQEVRPFLRRMLFSDAFGRRYTKERKPRTTGTTAGTKSKSAGAKTKSKSASKKKSTTRSSRPKVEPVAEVASDAEADGEAAAA